MHTDRRAILHLIALGRITPTEAERLLIAWNAGWESLWVVATCIAVTGLAQLNPHEWLPTLVHTAHSLLPWSLASIQHTLALAAHLFGGTL